MKWARVKPSKGKSVAETKQDIKNSFEQYPTLAALKKEVAKNFGVWVRYNFKKNLKPKAKKSYEMFCGGFLYFYDRHVRNKMHMHTIYCDWGNQNVTLWIKPKTKQNKNKSTYIKYLPSPVGDDPPKPPPPPPPPMG